jgi:hypothetical protein
MNQVRKPKCSILEKHDCCILGYMTDDLEETNKSIGRSYKQH